MNKPEFLVKFGNKVKQYREEQELSQEQLADIANLHRTYIGMIERAEKNITLGSMLKISKALKVSINDLVNGLDNEN